ncbi:hypothetical protein [Hymenobacter mucosus]|uniref:Curlin associated repeat-containing protein n=1 Tax=Hymenobacter mucosus TaxID=1411120 RepID=A0A238ZC23_9BACT|nr:hypothetical protein [Hymenobacter mucosus]SNR80313.1 Curlin associated repeat-containing protein [Hymenobacter mucosus]
MKTNLFAFLAAATFAISAHQGRAQSAAATEQQLLQELRPEQVEGTPAALVSTGRLNVAQLTQQGTANMAQITQVGSSNLTTITQAGTENVALSTITGYGTTSEITQSGTRNLVDQQLTVNQRQYSVLQQGANNQLRQVESGSQAPPGYEVKMVGNGINMTIQQGQATYRP